ncbi:MAG: hypothetical protein K8R90_03140 [Candidatus Cloacimonetes bacterium]|nr:hypothetical protein [Candidatus Cloacimonadota bacterium]
MSSSVENTADSPLLEWTSWPLVDYPRSSLFLTAFLVFLVWLLWQIAVVDWQMPLFYVLGIVFVSGSLITWFIPTRYRLWPDRVEAIYLSIRMKRQWSDFRCHYTDKKGVMLSTFAHQSRLDRFRGLSLRFSRNREEKEQLMAILVEKLGDSV